MEPIDEGGVHGFLHRAGSDALVLTHGAGSNCRAPLLVAVADALAGAGITVMRCDLPFRQARPHGPPHPSGAERDREGLRLAVSWLRGFAGGRVFLGGHSYGGRQATIAAASDPQLAVALLLLSYPLHPPKRPADLRTAHFPNLRTPALFVHGTRDSFGSSGELQEALKLVPGRTELVEVAGAGHDLRGAGAAAAAAFVKFIG